MLACSCWTPNQKSRSMVSRDKRDLQQILTRESWYMKLEANLSYFIACGSICQKHLSDFENITLWRDWERPWKHRHEGSFRNISVSRCGLHHVVIVRQVRHHWLISFMNRIMSSYCTAGVGRCSLGFLQGAYSIPIAKAFYSNVSQSP